MAQKPLDPDSPGGKAPLVATRIPHRQHELLLAAVRKHGLTVAEFVRNATEAELARLDAEIAAAATGPPATAE